MSRVRVAVFAAIGGALTGLDLLRVPARPRLGHPTRLDHGWLVWLLPAGRPRHRRRRTTTGAAARRAAHPRVIEQAHTFTHGVPARMAPLIFGGSVAGPPVRRIGRPRGRSPADGRVGHRHRRPRSAGSRADERRTLIGASLAGGWGAVFGVPVHRHRVHAAGDASPPLAGARSRPSISAFTGKVGGRPARLPDGRPAAPARPPTGPSGSRSSCCSPASLSDSSAGCSCAC